MALRHGLLLFLTSCLLSLCRVPVVAKHLEILSSREPIQLESSNGDALFRTSYELLSADDDWEQVETHAVQNLIVKSYGQVFVRYANEPLDSRVVARVQVTTTSVNAMKGIKLSSDEWNQIEISGSRPSHRWFGFYFDDDKDLDDPVVLIEVFVTRPHALQSVRMTGEADVIIGDSVLVQNTQLDDDQRLEFQSSGSGKLFVQTIESFHLDSLEIKTSGSGNVQFVGAQMQVKSHIELHASGGGSIDMLTAQLDAFDASLESTVSGVGGICVGSASSLYVSDINAKVSGLGAMTIRSQSMGHCRDLHATITGIGGIDIGSVACTNGKVKLASVGSIVLDVENQLTASISGPGEIQYVHAPPRVLSIKEHAFSQGVKHGSSLEFIKCVAVEVPRPVLQAVRAVGPDGVKPAHPDFPAVPSPPKPPVNVVVVPSDQDEGEDADDEDLDRALKYVQKHWVRWLVLLFLISGTRVLLSMTRSWVYGARRHNRHYGHGPHDQEETRPLSSVYV